MEKVLIIGTGYVGSRIGTVLKAQGFQVTAITKTPLRHNALLDLGLTPIACDILDSNSLKTICDHEILIFAASPGKIQTYTDVYLRGTKNILQEFRQRNSSPKLVLYLSSTGIWDDQNGQWIDETNLHFGTSEKSQILAQAESLVLNSKIPGLIFRLSGIYGPGRNRIAALKDGRWPETGPDRYINLIHVDDIVQASLLLIHRGAPQNIYLGVDDEPTLQSVYYEWICDKVGQVSNSNLFQKDKSPGGKRCRNSRLKSLGYVFKYPNFREGYKLL